MWQQRDQELALTRERERATKEKERQRREREGGISGGIWPPGIGGSVGLNDHIEVDKESYSYVQFARGGKQINAMKSILTECFISIFSQYWSSKSLFPLTARVQLPGDA